MHAVCIELAQGSVRALAGALLGLGIGVPFAAFRHNRAGGRLDTSFIPVLQTALERTTLSTTLFSGKLSTFHLAVIVWRSKCLRPCFTLSLHASLLTIAVLAGIGLIGLKEGWNKEKIEDRVYRLHYNAGQNRMDMYSSYGGLAGTALAGLAGGQVRLIYEIRLHCPIVCTHAPRHFAPLC